PLAGFDEPVVVDLGPVSEMRLPGPVLSDEAAAAVYQRLFATLEPKLAAATTVHVAPDGVLNLVPFARRKLPDGRYWAERQEVRLLQTGRDLPRPDPDRPAHGLLALGGIDFGATAIKAETPDSTVLAATGLDHAGAITRAAGTFRDGFVQLPASGDEANEVTERYQRLRKDEPAEG